MAGKWIAVLAASLVMAAQAAQAASPPSDSKEDSSVELGPITTTATRVAAPSYNVPASISTVTAQDIRESHLGINFSESVKAIPGLLARSRQNYAQDEQISIRGFGARTTFGVRGVRLYIDGIPASFPDGQGQVSNFNLASASRIEVLRGPFSALYGNSSGGVIQIFTADGHRPNSVYAGTAWGSYDTLRANVGANGVVGKLDYNANFTHFRTGGFRPHSSARRDLFQGKFTWHFDSATTLTAVLNNFSGPQAQDPGGLTRAQFEANPRQTASGNLEFNTRKSAQQHLGGLIFKHDFGNGQSIRLMGYYGARQVKQFLPIPIGSQSPPTSGGGVIDLHDNYGGADARWTWHTHLLSQPFTVVAGVAYDAENERRRGWNNFTGSGSSCSDPGVTCGVRGALRRSQRDVEYDLAQYAQLEWDPGKWVLSVGVRHNRVHFNSHDHFLANGNGSGEAVYYATTPVVGVMYKPVAWAHPYADFGEGFQTPTFSELAYSASSRSAHLNLGLKAARTENAQVGVKFRLPWNTNANIALFRAQTRNELVVNTNAHGRSTYTNAGRVRRQGLEFFADHAFSERLRLQVAYTYLDATVRSSYLTCTSFGCTTPADKTHIAAGSRLPGVPESQLFAGLRWGRDTGLHAGIDAQYLSNVPVNSTNTEAAPAYGLIDTNIGYVFDLSRYRVGVFARINNLLDTDYVGSVIVNGSGGRYFETGPGRSFLLGVNVRWKAS